MPPYKDKGDSVPLLLSGSRGYGSTSLNYGSYSLPSEQKSKMAADKNANNDSAKIEKSLNLPTATLLMASCCCGTGIFVSPTGVTAAVGSAGLTLVIWLFCGLFSMVLALCYAELGTAIPLAGGDYTYIATLLGPLPGFLCLWVMVFLIGPIASTLMGLTAGEYFASATGNECSPYLPLAVSFLLMFTSCILNIYSTKWSARVASYFSMGKVIALLIIIVVGIMQLAKGNTDSFRSPFEGSNFSPTAILFAIVPSFVSYGGWDAVNSLAEEMTNPKRDIPIVAVVGLLGVTFVYVFVNIAYFSVLTPEEFVETSIVVMAFSEQTMPSVPWIASTFVIVAASGSLLNLFLMAPRWTFAGGRNGQMPVIFSYIHIHYCTPIAAIILKLVITLIFATAASFFDILAVVNILGLFAQIKICLALVALIYMKRKRKDLKGTVQMPMSIVVISLILLLVVTAVAIYVDPVVMGFGFLLFLAGIPLYLMQKYINSKGYVDQDEPTLGLQKLLLVVPEESKED